MARKTNLALVALVPAAIATGLLSNLIGRPWPLDPAVIHGAVALGVLLLAPWKSIIVRRGLRRSRPGRWSSLVLTGLVVIAIGTGLLHSTGLVYTLGPLTVMQVHVGSALLTIPFVIDHYRRHPVKPRRTDLSRRAVVRSTLLTGGAALAWLGWEGVGRAAGWPGAQRRFTGSHERGSHEPEAMPVVSWLDDPVPAIDPDTWRLRVGGTEYTIDDLAALPHDTFPAVLDCTGGWFAEQTWSGVRLDRLIDPAGWRSVGARSATGYTRRYPADALDRTWLVTMVEGAPLSPGHGFPARIVAPGRRGFWWLKWVESLEPSMRPWWVQWPFPVT